MVKAPESEDLSGLGSEDLSALESEDLLADLSALESEDLLADLLDSASDRGWDYV